MLVYPVCDCRFDTGSYVSNGEGYLLEAEQMQWFFDCYTGGDRRSRPGDHLAASGPRSHAASRRR